METMVKLNGETYAHYEKRNGYTSIRIFQKFPFLSHGEQVILGVEVLERLLDKIKATV